MGKIENPSAFVDALGGSDGVLVDTSDSIIPSSTGGDFLSHGDTPGAMEFLGWFRPKGWMNLVAIPQDTGPPIGITRSTGDPDLESFITKHNGKKKPLFHGE